MIEKFGNRPRLAKSIHILDPDSSYPQHSSLWSFLLSRSFEQTMPEQPRRRLLDSLIAPGCSHTLLIGSKAGISAETHVVDSFVTGSPANPS